MSQTYRWNVAEHAAGYDAAAEVIHPHYREVQQAVLEQITRPLQAEFLAVDLGGGSGRLAEILLSRFPNATAVIVDQSEPFLELARTRLERFGERARFVVARLQDHWAEALPAAPSVIVSTSAIHHLDADEKQALFQQCYDALEPLGIFVNGDEIRADDDGEYRAALEKWGVHMREIVADGRVPESFHEMLEKWQDRNIRHFEKPRTSGDDCHQPLRTQLGYLCDCGFRTVNSPWQRDMWAVMLGVK